MVSELVSDHVKGFKIRIFRFRVFPPCELGGAYKAKWIASGRPLNAKKKIFFFGKSFFYKQMNNLKSGGTLFLAYKGRMGRASVMGITEYLQLRPEFLPWPSQASVQGQGRRGPDFTSL